MAATFVRLTVVADDNQLDVSLPAQRPVVEYIDDVVGLLGPTVAGTDTVWTVSTPTHGPIDLEDTLADHQILDGARLYLTKAPEAAPPPFVDDVLTEIRRRIDGQFTAWDPDTRRVSVSAAFAVVTTVGSLLIAGDDARWAVVAVLAALACGCLLLGSSLRSTVMGHVVWAAVIPAGIGLWRAADGLELAEQLVFAMAAICAVAAVCAASQLRSASIAAAAAATSALLAVAGAGFAGGANPVATSVWALPFLVIAVIVAPKWSLASSGLLAQVRLSEQMELASRDSVARGLRRGRRAADVLVWTASALVVPAVATIALNGVWEQGLAAAVMVVIWLLRSRNFAHSRHVAPMIVAVGASAAFLVCGLAGWLGMTGGAFVVCVGGGVAALAVLFVVCALPPLDEVTAARIRRFLDAVDTPLALAFVPIVFFAQGVYTLVWPS